MLNQIEYRRVSGELLFRQPDDQNVTMSYERGCQEKLPRGRVPSVFLDSAVRAAGFREKTTRKKRLADRARTWPTAFFGCPNVKLLGMWIVAVSQVGGLHHRYERTTGCLKESRIYPGCVLLVLAI
jgi:hypothetical protein